MSLFVNLPSVLFVGIVDILMPVDLVKFDSACCNVNTRRSLLKELELLPSGYFPVNALPSIGQYKWINARKLKLDKLLLDSRALTKQLTLAFDVDFSLITTVKILGQAWNKAGFVKIINSCTNLKELLCSSFDPFTDISPSILNQLTHAVIDDAQGDNSSIKRLAEHCTKLEKLSFIHIPPPIKKFTSVLASNPLLRELECFATPELLDHVIDSWPGITKIRMIFRDLFNLSAMRRGITRNPNIHVDLICGSVSVDYEGLPSKRRLTINYYPDEADDLEPLVSATRDLTSFVTMIPVSAATIDSLIDNSAITLQSFMCDMSHTNVDDVKRLLIHCKVLQDLRLSQVKDTIVGMFESLPDLRVTTVMLAGQKLRLSTVSTVLRMCRHLTRSEFFVVSKADMPLDQFKKEIQDYTNTARTKFTCEVQYKQDKKLKKVVYDGNAFQFSVVNDK